MSKKGSVELWACNVDLILKSGKILKGSALFDSAEEAQMYRDREANEFAVRSRRTDGGGWAQLPADEEDSTILVRLSEVAGIIFNVSVVEVADNDDE